MGIAAEAVVKDAIAKLAKAMGRPDEEVRTALNDCDLSLVWDPEKSMPPETLLAVHRTAITREGAESYWWTLKPLDKGKHANRSTGEVFRWK